MIAGIDDSTSMEHEKPENITCSIHSSFEEIEDMRLSWDSFVESIGGEIFLTFDWCRIWWKYYGNKRELRVFILRDNGVIVALLPMFLERIGVWPFSVKIAKIVGSDFTMAHFTLPIKPEYCRLALQKFLNELNGQIWDLCCLWPLTCLSHSADELTLLFMSTNSEHIIQVEKEGMQTVFEIPDSYESYLSKLSPKERSAIRRNYNLLQKNKISLQSNLATKENFKERFSAFVEMHQHRWKLSGKPGHFGDWPQAFKFHKEIAESQLQFDRLRLLKLQLGQDCAYRYYFEFGHKYFLFLYSRPLTVTLSAIDYGRLLYSETIQRAIEHGVKCMDGMRGAYDYKLRLGGRATPLVRVRIARKGLVNSIRLAIFNNLSQVIDLLYYKIWYCRLAPRLPFTYGPLCSFWIKTTGLFPSKLSIDRHPYLKRVFSCGKK